MKRVFAHIGFSVAVTLVVLNLLKIKYVFIAAIGLAVIFTASLILPVFRRAMVVPVCTASAVIACMLFLCFYNGTVAPQLAMEHKQADVSFYIVDTENYDGEYYTYTVKTTAVKETGAPQSIKMRLKSKVSIDAEAYRVIHSEMTLFSIGESGFSSYGYWGKGIYLSGTLGEYSVTNEHIKSPWKSVLSLRQDIMRTLSNHIHGDSGAVAVALLTGNKMKLSDESYTNFKYAGASHIMAVSGFHLTVLVGMIVFLMKRMHFNDKCISVVTVFSVLLVIGLAGFSKSVIRAGIMMLVMTTAKLMNRRADALNSLGISVFLICLNPFAVTDIGAQLSVLSVLSLLTLQPHLIKLFDKNAVSRSDGFIAATYTNKLLGFGVSGFTVALSIMIYTMPVMYLFFGYVSMAGLISNIFVVPLGSLCIIVTLLSYIGIKLNILAAVLSKICGSLNGVLLWLVHRFASIENSVISISWYFGFVLAVIAVSFAVCFFFANKKMMKKVGIVSACVVMAFFTLFSFLNNSANVLVCRGAVAVCSDDTVLVYNVTTKSEYYSVKQFLTARHTGIDTIISPNNNDYSIKLAEYFGCDTYVTSKFSDEIMYNPDIKRVEYCRGYSISDSIFTEYHKINDRTYCLFTINNVTIAVGDEPSADCDITVRDHYIHDAYGIINNKNDEIIYTINDSGVYSARRVDAWQK